MTVTDTPNRRGGAPTDLTRPVTYTDPATGQTRTTTCAERIIELRRLGFPLAKATQATGLNARTSAGWQATGGKAAVKLAQLYDPDDPRLADDPDPDGHLTAFERGCWAFVQAEAAAAADWVLGAHGLLTQLARGGIVQERTVEKYEVQVLPPDPADGPDAPQRRREVLVERTTTRDRTLPDKHVLMWMLERMHPFEYGRQVGVLADVTVHHTLGQLGGLSDEDRVRALAESAQALVEATARDITDDDGVA